MTTKRRTRPRVACAHCGARIHSKNDDWCFRGNHGICARCGKTGRTCAPEAPTIPVNVPGVGSMDLDARVVLAVAETVSEMPFAHDRLKNISGRCALCDGRGVHWGEYRGCRREVRCAWCYPGKADGP